ncbi:MAG: hypothetical protein AAF493_07335 [Pseudomonadota bacterium]
MAYSIYSVDGIGGGTLSIAPRPPGGDGLSDAATELGRRGVDWVVSLLASDEVIRFGLGDAAGEFNRCGIRFSSFAIQDFGTPSVDQAAELVTALCAGLREGQHILLHCHGGVGRSGLMAAAVMIASGFDVRRSIQSISTARGCQIPETPAQRAWLEAFASRTGLR